MLRPRGANSMGHKGWHEFKCAICAKKLYIGDTVTFKCPKCDTYFCEADAKRLRYRCPYCGSDLVSVP